MIRFFAAHPTAANLLMVTLIVMGVFAVPSLRRETFPEVPADEIQVEVKYPGATTDDVEEAICGRIEDAIDGVDDVVEVRSEARESLASVTVQIAPGADARVVLDDLRTEIQAIDDLPDQAEAPVLRQLGRTEAVASVAVSGDLQVEHLKALCEQMKRRLLREPEISIVDVVGFSDHQLRIEVPAATLASLGLGAEDIARAIAAQSVDLPGGTLTTVDGDVLIRFDDQRRTVAELEDLTVLSGESGAELRLGDFAEITDRFELDEERFVFDGVRAGLLAVKKTRAQDTLDVVAAIRRVIADEQPRLPPSCRLTLTQDSSSIVADRLAMLVENGWQGLLLVFFALWLFFSFRLSMWVAFGLPVSFLGALAFMVWIDYSINMMTMVGLLLALGLLMDDSLVLAENIATHLGKGKSAIQAAIDGASEVRVGILSSFATTLAVFVPLSSLDGDIGAVLSVLPVVLILVLAVSLVEAFLILPAHLGHSLGHEGDRPPPRFRVWFEGRFDALRERVLGRAVDLVVHHRYPVIGLAVGALLVSFGMLASGRLAFQALPSIDGDVIHARLLMPPGTPFARTEAAVDQLVDAFERVGEQLAPAQPAGTELRRNVSVRFNYNEDAHETGPHLATVTVDLLSAEVRGSSIDEILTRWRVETGDVLDAIAVRFGEPSVGPAGRPIEVRVQGDDLGACASAADELAAWFRTYEGVFDVSHDLRLGKREVRVRMREGAMSLGTSARDVADDLRASFLGDVIGEVRVGGEDYEIESRVGWADRDSIEDLERMRVGLGDGTLVPLESVARLEEGRGYARIARVDGVRTVTVEGDVDSSVTNVSALMALVERDALPPLREKYPDVEFSIEGETKNGAETGASLGRAFLFGLLGVFVLLSFQFRGYLEPLVVMAAIPMCLVGVIWGHLAMGLDLTLPSLLGFVSLAGIVVNDSILLVTFVKRRLRAGDDPVAAARAASRLRFRAVLLTSLTTIVGMAPLLTETSPQAQILIPLAASIVFGMLSSTVLVLLLIPAFYAVLGDLGKVRA